MAACGWSQVSLIESALRTLKSRLPKDTRSGHRSACRSEGDQSSFLNTSCSQGGPWLTPVVWYVAWCSTYDEAAVQRVLQSYGVRPSPEEMVGLMRTARSNKVQVELYHHQPDLTEAEAGSSMHNTYGAV